MRNLEISPDVVLEIGGEKRATKARLVTDRDEDILARKVVVEKYRPRHKGDLDDWGRTSLPVAIDWG